MNEFLVAIESHPITALLCWLGLVIIAQAIRTTINYYTGKCDKNDD
mgnify:CR=1 FL=1